MPEMSYKKLIEGRCDDGDTLSLGIFPENSDIFHGIHKSLQNRFIEKINKYHDVKSNIFSVSPNINDKITKCRLRYKRRKLIEKSISETIIDTSTDFRPYVQVLVNGVQVKGLLDSGAQISCLDFVTKNNIPYKHIPKTKYVKTASGQSQEIIGYFNAQLSFQDQEHELILFLIPSLEQDLYLGTDFWSEFQIATHLIPPRISSISKDFSQGEDSVRENACMHNLTLQQQRELEKIKMQFPSYNISGLGKTHILTHKIDVQGAAPVKAKHYPVSPPIQKLIDSEIDRMLEMKVIEESNSPWNSPVVLVRKPNKIRLCLDSRKINSLTKKMHIRYLMLMDF